ncbi:HK97-gp10 family putative phage morphogenesis protein [Roseicyclus marinus]|uniref:HK97-gp10 family putative phage morphogenesis protein n=1 Tax=Roseicyclus marinus TaxID=2161673 RepID=UPI00240FE9BD|nr:HK97-gp10 family putative phage morphogenesis protein [Roseicyclus marinus]MDG3040440.1 HK97 gp10 family phage protein [Roseicyclus marinus]
MVSFRVEGFREMEAALDELASLSTRRSVARRALIKAAQPMAELMRSLAPDDPNTANEDLVGSIAVSPTLSDRQRGLHRRMFPNHRTSVEVFVGAGPVPQAHLQEFGTQHHAPQPFGRPAFDMDARNLIDRLGREMWSEIQRSVARARRRQARS